MHWAMMLKLLAQTRLIDIQFCFVSPLFTLSKMKWSVKKKNTNISNAKIHNSTFKAMIIFRCKSSYAITLHSTLFCRWPRALLINDTNAYNLNARTFSFYFFALRRSKHQEFAQKQKKNINAPLSRIAMV